MGDENSLQGRTQAHKHESASSTGGFLKAGITGMSDLSHGSIVYGSAAEIVTELPVASNGDVLELSGGIPSWQTPAGSGSNFEFLGSASIVGGSPLTVSFAGVGNPDFVISTFAGEAAASQEVAYQVNGITSSTYNNQGTYFLAGGNSNQNVTNNDKFYGISSGITGTPQGITYFKVFTNPISENIYTQSESYTASNGYSIFGGYNSTAAQTSITSITCLGNPFSGTLSCWAVRN
jgi:hypothetical protein